jgi:hypothetical protein
MSLTVFFFLMYAYAAVAQLHAAARECLANRQHFDWFLELLAALAFPVMMAADIARAVVSTRRFPRRWL